MARLRNREIVHASYLWHDAAGEPWLLTFDFADVGGRLECVAMSMRSFVWDEAGEPGDEYAAYWNPTREQREAVDDDFHGRGGSRLEPRALRVFDRHDPDAAAALGSGSGRHAEPWNERGLMPRRLRSTDVRGLPLGDVLVRVRRLLAQTVDDLMPPSSVLDAGDDALEVWQSGLRDVLVPDPQPRPSRGGRPPKYSREDLERAAAFYRHAFETQDAPSPTKYVAERMGLSPDAASKVVRKCRDAGLLGRTTRGRAGGIDNLTPDRVIPNPEANEGSTP